MIDLSSQSLYELLDVEPDATIEEIKRAYRIALRSYATDHMATYCLFTRQQREEIVKRVEEAYGVLMDPRLRRQYDETLKAGEKTPRPRQQASSAPPRPEAPPERVLESGPPGPEEPAGDGNEGDVERRIGDLLARAEDTGEWSGELLGRIREIRGIGLDQVAGQTKISLGHLKFIESNDYEYLPPDVYVKGFLRQISLTLGLDPAYVVPRVMASIQAARGKR